MKQFYLEFPILHALRGELTWTHYRLLLKVQNETARQYYLQESIDCQWSTRELERQVNSFYYERILTTKKPALLNAADQSSEKLTAVDVIKDPFVLEFLGVEDNRFLSEQALESALMDKLQAFLLELGKGFSFVKRQKRITTDNEHFYIDLVFYNYLLKCFVLVDLKIGKLTHKDIGQIDFYVRYWEDNCKAEDDNPTIGIVLCTEKNEAVIKYSVLENSRQLFAAKYQLYLPTEAELQAEIIREMQIIAIEQGLKNE
jgi:predicted nuclease of restriction endonuclease-like (RecB) superfamily